MSSWYIGGAVLGLDNRNRCFVFAIFKHRLFCIQYLGQYSWSKKHIYFEVWMIIQLPLFYWYNSFDNLRYLGFRLLKIFCVWISKKILFRQDRFGRQSFYVIFFSKIVFICCLSTEPSSQSNRLKLFRSSRRDKTTKLKISLVGTLLKKGSLVSFGYFCSFVYGIDKVR
jgi:hypothetical protein